MEKPKTKWYFRTSYIIIAFLCVGPLMLPMVWFNPHYKTWLKIVLTIICLVAGYYMAIGTIELVKLLGKLYRDLGQLGLDW
ncbi:MAG: hypothetical protein AB1599_07385 [Planctomycetota bacterium]